MSKQNRKKTLHANSNKAMEYVLLICEQSLSQLIEWNQTFRGKRESRGNDGDVSDSFQA